MSKVLEMLDQARKDELVELFNQLTDPQQKLFMRMYSHDDLSKPIDQVVAEMPKKKVDWAITQCERTILKNAEKSKS